VELIGQALGSIPAAERRDFWATHIEKDAALAVLRNNPSFHRLEYDNSRAN
jgi:hypothetical protein